TMPRVTLVAGMSTNGLFNLQFEGINGRNYVVETSTDLVDWVPVFTNMPDNGVFLFTDSNATAAARFYRVR
ncbi:MAG TPA: hypothetical protein VFF11_05195, partial [Candidatus Binatia bacterium]|nr:hypothetical protein [Candidatus Binatia bacterium]